MYMGFLITQVRPSIFSNIWMRPVIHVKPHLHAMVNADPNPDCVMYVAHVHELNNNYALR